MNATVLLVSTSHSGNVSRLSLPLSFAPSSMVPGRFHTVDRLLCRWDRPSVSRGPVKHDMAEHACDLCVVQHPSLATVRWERTVSRNQPRTVLPIRFRSILSMV